MKTAADCIWVGTRDGLNRLLPEEETLFFTILEDGLPSDIVYGGILEDAKEQIG